MPESRPALPAPQNDAEASVIADIQEHGWHVVIVRSGVHDHETPGPWSDHAATQAAYEAQFTYTMGQLLLSRAT